MLMTCIGLTFFLFVLMAYIGRWYECWFIHHESNHRGAIVVVDGIATYKDGEIEYFDFAEVISWVCLSWMIL